MSEYLTEDEVSKIERYLATDDPDYCVHGYEDMLITDWHKAQAELRRLRNQVLEIHTMIECRACKRGVRASYAVGGMCVECAEAELERLRNIEAALTDIMEDFDHELPEVILWWRCVAEDAPAPVGRVCNAIADALEVKP